MQRYCHITFFVLLFIPLSVFSQGEGGRILFSDSSTDLKCKLSDGVKDSLAIQHYFQRCIFQLQSKGYLEARIDSISYESLPVIAFGYKGNLYQWATLSADSISKDLLSNSGINPKRITGKTLIPNQLSLFSDRILDHLDRSGYPFAQVSYVNTIIKNGLLSTCVSIEKGPLIRFDTLYVKGDANISNRFLRSYLGFVKEEPYSEKKIKSYDKKLQTLSFASVIRPTEVEFIPGKARVYTYITNQRSSRFSGLVGLQSEGVDGSKIKLTGDLNLILTNTFRNGERNAIKWQAPGEGTQRLNISTLWPYLFGSNFGINAKFLLYRRDTTYINTNPEVMIDFFLPNGNSLGLGFEYRSSSTLSSGTSLIGDYSTSLYRISYTSGLTSDDIFPSKYFWTKASVSIGTRTADSSIDSNNESKQSVGEANGSVTFYYPIFADAIVLHMHSQTQLLFQVMKSDPQFRFLENELYRIGGYQVLRGFNQESILTNGYFVAGAELQFRLQKTLNFIVFYDKGLVSTYSLSGKIVSYPYGFGLGFQLATAAGILNLNYALGQGFGQKITLSDAKIHVGFIANF